MAHAPSDTAMGGAVGGNGQDASFWRSHTTIALSPVAAPSILGLYGFSAATFMVGAGVAGWTTATSPVLLAPLALVFGGLAQFLAGMWSFRARDGLATAMHGMWGSFWIAFGILVLIFGPAATALVAIVRDPIAAAAVGGVRIVEVSLGYWFIVLAAITWVGAAAAIAKNAAFTLYLATLAAGSTILAIAWIAPYSVGVSQAAGDVLVASAVIAFYTASALMLEGAFQRTVLPVGPLFQHGRPRRAHLEPIQFELGEPGVKAGQ